MLDPKEMQKGGFGSFHELERERREQRRVAETSDVREASLADTAEMPANQPDRSGADTPAAEAEAEAISSDTTGTRP